MKQLTLLSFICALLAAPAQASTVAAYASEILSTSSSSDCEITVNTTNCDFVVPGRAIGLNELEATIADSSNPDVGSFIFSYFRDEAFIQLGFGDQQVVTGTGADLVIFTIGNGYRFGLTVLDNNESDPQVLSNLIYTVPSNGDNQAVNENGERLSLMDDDGNPIADISATAIDIDGVLDGTEIGSIILFIGNDYNGIPDGNGNIIGADNRPLFSLAGANFTASPVPLPLPVVLFGSGLALLGFIGRRKTL